MYKNKKRIQNLIEVVMQVATGNYDIQAELLGKNDDLDALAMGLNMMIEDLKNNLDLSNQNERMKQINIELEKATEKAKESDRLKSAFLANMSHEIRSPMNAIIGFASVLERDNISAEKKVLFYKYIKDSGHQLLGLIDDIIDVSKIESNQLKITRNDFLLKDLLMQVFEEIKQSNKLKQKNDLRLINSFSTDCSWVIYTDQVRFKQIITNLLNNAIKFTHKGFVELGSEILDNGNERLVRIFVKDTGIGIEEKDHQAIFERFKQAHFDTFQEGTGLGLNISKSLIEILGGRIELKSKLGEGAVFSVFFPVKLSNQSSQKMSVNIVQDDKRQTIEDKAVIYIAEDRYDSFLYLNELLQGFNFEIHHANNGAELLNLINKKIPDMVLLDMHMPMMNGYEAIRKIRAMNLKFPVIAQTAYAMSNDREQIINAGCDGYITKPIAASELLDEMHKYLVL